MLKMGQVCDAYTVANTDRREEINAVTKINSKDSKCVLVF